MNKLVFFCLLTLMIVYSKSAECGDIATPPDQKACDAATGVPSGKTCKFVAEVKDGDTVKTPAKCQLADKATNSSDNLNIFKVTLALLIIFTIL